MLEFVDLICRENIKEQNDESLGVSGVYVQTAKFYLAASN